MSGTYRLNLDGMGTNGTYSSGRTIAAKGTLDVPVIAQSIQVKMNVTGTFAGKAVIYRNSDLVKVAESVTQNLAVTAGSSYDIAFTAPVQLDAGVVYLIGVYSPGAYVAYYSSTFFSNNATFGSTPTYATFSKLTGLYYATGDNCPTATATGEPGWGLYFNAPNVLPTAPTGLTTNSPVTAGNQLTANWTHNDPDGNPQSQYQLRWRKN